MPLASHPMNSMRIHPGHYFGRFKSPIFTNFIERWTRALVIQLVEGRFSDAEEFSSLFARPQVVWEII